MMTSQFMVGSSAHMVIKCPRAGVLSPQEPENILSRGKISSCYSERENQQKRLVLLQNSSTLSHDSYIGLTLGLYTIPFCTWGNELHLQGSQGDQRPQSSMINEHLSFHVFILKSYLFLANFFSNIDHSNLLNIFLLTFLQYELLLPYLPVILLKTIRFFTFSRSLMEIFFFTLFKSNYIIIK